MSCVFLLGGPGSGKGTQSELISEHFNFKHLSAGDLLRAERNRPDSEFGSLIEQYIVNGQIVPVEITVNLIKRAIEDEIATPNGKQRFLIDGFPRNKDNLQGWEKVMANKYAVKGVLFFDCPESVMEERLLKRGANSNRSDDNLESIRKRFKVYSDETMPIIEIFKTQGICQTISTDKDVMVVWSDVQKVLFEWGF
jgi:UMP-CMP kinase